MSKKKAAAKRAATPASSSKWRWIGLAAVAVVIIAVAALTQLTNRPATVSDGGAAVAVASEISVAEAAQKRSEGAFILDVREPSEWAQVHIPDATLIPLGELAARVNELPRDQEIVVVCRSGNRSQQARDILRQAGFTTVTSMAGGMNQWQSQGLPTESGS